MAAKKTDTEKEQTTENSDDSKSQGNGRRQKQSGKQQSGARELRSTGNDVQVRRDETRELEPSEVFDPVSAARLATLRLARNWRLGGNTYGAMHAYERILAKYGGTPAAHAAAEELIAMAGELEREGKFYTALNIFNKVEEYYEPRYGDTYDQPRPTRYRSRRGRSNRGS
jgi:hypothetical protein